MQLAVQVKLMKYQNDLYSVPVKFKSRYEMNLMHVSSDVEQCNRVCNIMISRVLCISVQLAVQVKLMKYQVFVHTEINHQYWLLSMIFYCDFVFHFYKYV